MFKTVKKWIVKFFGRNPFPKLVAVAIAVLLWIVVASGQSTLGKFPGTIPVQANNIPQGLTAIIDDEEVEIEVMAEPAVWNSLSEDSFTAYVDVSSLKEGTYELDVQVSTSVDDVTITKVTPEKIFVRLESIVTEDILVTHRVEGSAAEGLVVGNVELVPDTISVSGPSSQVGKINEVNVIIRLNGESNDFERLEKVVVFGSDGKEVSNMVFNPLEVLAKISLVKASNNKTVGVKVKTSGTPKEGYFVSKITVTPSVVDVTGPNSILRGINYVETDPIELNGKSETIEREVFLNLIDGTALQRGQSSRARVVVELAEEATTKVVDLTIMPQNLATNLIFSYSPIPIKVILTGTSQALLGVESDDITIDIDLVGKEAGSQNYELDINNITLPENVTVTSLVPSSINVVLEQK